MFYLLDKPKGISSFKAIRNFGNDKGIKKIGHTGTLDPLATGLLLIATDDDTKLIDYVDKGFKSYRTIMILGKQSDTYDIEGEITLTKKSIPSKEEVINAINSFVGKQEQMPPAFSAKKVNGKRAYDLAREGKEVKLKTSSIEIKSIANIKFLSDVEVEFEVEVSRGTYIRSLIHDIGQKISCGALMSELRRITIGNLNESMIGEEISIENLLTIPLIDGDNMKDLLNGKVQSTNKQDGIYALKYKGDIYGIVQVENKILKPKKLFGNKFQKAGV